MTALTACFFDTADGADDAVRRMISDAERYRGVVDNAATLRWDEGEARPRSLRRPELASSNALGDGFWSLVVGLTLLIPLLGAAVGGVAGATGASLGDAGIGETFMNQLRDALTPGRSALLTIGPQSPSELVFARTAGLDRSDYVVAEISDRQLAALREVFAT
jgi:uncharacterized membrane protein